MATEPARAGQRVLVVARGTTCVRVARSVRALGMEPVGVLTPEDRHCLWSTCLAQARAVSAYDAVEELVAAATGMGAALVHPGVGFAAESAHLATACEQAGLTWVGPPPQVLDQLSDKVALSRLAGSLGIRTPRLLGRVRSVDELGVLVRQAGTDVVVKTVRGGGGRGVVLLGRDADASALERTWDMVVGLGDVMVQEALPAARHVEVQALADGHDVLTAGTRECSVQRRAQKILQEAPAPFMPGHVVARMEEETRRLLAATGYRGAGTCEFLVTDDGDVALLEVNARLQVEHAVTEEVTGVDLVATQLRLAQGARLAQSLVVLGAPDEDDSPTYPASPSDPAAPACPASPRSPADPAADVARAHGVGAQGDRLLSLPLRGHAVQARLYAEDPDTLLPQSGTLTALRLPVSTRAEMLAATHPSRAGSHGPAARLRTERGAWAGQRVPTGFSDPLALLTSVAATRTHALDALDEAVSQVDCRGVATLAPLLRQVLAHPDLRARPRYAVTTTWLTSVLRPTCPTAGSVAVATAGSQAGGLPRASAPRLKAGPAPAPAGPGRTGAPGGVGVSARVGEQASGQTAGAAEEVRAPMPGVVVALADSGRIAAGAPVAVLEAMKMRLPLPAPSDGVLTTAGALRVGATVRAGQLLATISPTSAPALQPDCAPTLPAPAVTRPGPGTAARRVRDLVDEDSLTDVVDDDAVLTARARLRGRPVAVWAQDPGTRGGTIGLAGARRVARLIRQAAASGTPVVSLLDGGGARVQEGADALAGVGLILAAESAARGACLQVGVVLGPAAGGAAYAPALTDILIMVEGQGEIFLTGPAVTAASTGEQVSADQLGGAAVHARQAGTAHLVVPDEPAAWRTTGDLISYAPFGTDPRTRRLALYPGGLGTRVTASDQPTGAVVPTTLTQPYDVRDLLTDLVDRGEMIELRGQWAPNVVTALARVDGVPLGVVATQPSWLAGAMDARASQKVAEHLDLCARLGLPLLTLVDTPGFLPGTDAEAGGTVRYGARVVDAYARYQAAAGPLLTLVTRRAFGGAYVALGSAALAAGRTAAWPHAVIGVMDPSTAVGLVARRELEQAEHHGEDVQAVRAALVAGERARQDVQVVREQGWVDDVIEPAASRAWIAGALSDALVRTAQEGQGAQAPYLRARPVWVVHHDADDWVDCACGRRHWGRCGAAGTLVWRWEPGTGSPTHRSRGRIEVLLQLRAAWTHHGATWGLPGGALAQGEEAAEAAVRELEEETGLSCSRVRLGASHVQDHGTWRYTTFVAQAPSDHRWDWLAPCDGESTSLAWVGLEVAADGRLALPQPPSGQVLPALAAVWDALAGLLVEEMRRTQETRGTEAR